MQPVSDRGASGSASLPRYDGSRTPSNADWQYSQFVFLWVYYTRFINGTKLRIILSPYLVLSYPILVSSFLRISEKSRQRNAR
jgi:hypothetical protein